MVKENLIKKVKLITTSVSEAAVMAYLATIFAIKPEEQHDWIATCAPVVCDALNNKPNIVVQDLKVSNPLFPCIYEKYLILTPAPFL